jgi:hypothetical protein
LAAINLKDTEQLTYDNVAKLIGSVTDDRHWQLRVTKDGVAYLSEIVGADDIGDLTFRMETWCAGNGYVGPQAALDETWVNRVLKDLQQNWPRPESSYIDF